MLLLREGAAVDLMGDLGEIRGSDELAWCVVGIRSVAIPVEDVGAEMGGIIEGRVREGGVRESEAGGGNGVEGGGSGGAVGGGSGGGVVVVGGAAAGGDVVAPAADPLERG